MNTLASFWDAPPVELAGSNEEFHVWRASLDQPASRIQRLAQLLTLDERERAERFNFALHRRRFIVGRGILRMILSGYLDIAPERLRFCCGPFGKPFLADAAGRNSLRFNLSHSHNLALCAVTRLGEIGVDLEFMRPVIDMAQIAERNFSSTERAVLHRLPIEQKQQAFFNCWTRKEAYLKARGEGLSFPLDQFDVSLIPGEPTKLLNTRPDPREALKWTLYEVNPAPGFVAALAVEGNRGKLCCWQWPDDFDKEPVVDGLLSDSRYLAIVSRPMCLTLSSIYA